MERTKIQDRNKDYFIDKFISKFRTGMFIGGHEPSIITAGNLILCRRTKSIEIIYYYKELNEDKSIRTKYIPKTKIIKITKSEFKHIISQVWKPSTELSKL